MKQILLILTFQLSLATLGSLEPSLLVERFSDQVLAGTLNTAELTKSLDQVVSEISVLDSRDKLEALAQVYLTAAVLELQRENKELTRRWLDQAERYALELHKRPTPTSRALLAEIKSRAFGVRDVGYIIANAPGLQSEAESILAVDPGNLRARFILASGKLYAPGLFGGDPRISLRLFMDILAQTGIPQYARFQALIGVGESLGKLGDPSGRRQYLERAKSLYPKNPGLEKLLGQGG